MLPLPLHAHVYAIADRYQIEGLAALAKENFASASKNCCDSSDTHSAIRLVYSTTPPEIRGLRDVVVGFMTANKNSLFKDSMFSASFVELIDEVGESSKDLRCLTTADRHSQHEAAAGAAAAERASWRWHHYRRETQHPPQLQTRPCSDTTADRHFR